MIYEGKDPSYEEVVNTLQVRGTLICRHDFWDQAFLMEYGDVILCQRCGQYFAKIKHIPCLIDKGNVITSNHQTKDVWVKVPVRILENDNQS